MSRSGSTEKNDNRRWLLLDRLSRVSDKRPELTFAELIAGGIREVMSGSLEPDVAGRLARTTDAEFMAAIEKFAMLDPGGSKPAE